SLSVRNCVSKPRISSERKTNNSSPAFTGWPSSTPTWLMIPRTGDWIGSAPVAGTGGEGQCNAPGHRITIAISSPKRNAANNIHAVERMIQGGGSCGNISDSTSSEPRGVSCELMKEAALDPQLLAREIIIQTALCH